MMELDTIFCGDALDVLRTLPDNFVHCCITSPPYYALRDYGAEGQIGREERPAQYVARLTEVFSEVWRVLRPNGTLWLNIADTYDSWNNGKRKCAPPERVSEKRLQCLQQARPDLTADVVLDRAGRSGVPQNDGHPVCVCLRRDRRKKRQAGNDRRETHRLYVLYVRRASGKAAEPLSAHGADAPKAI